MAEQSLHAGGEGNVLAGGVDWGITTWDATETVETAESTSTKNYDAGENTTYTQDEPTKRSLTGSFKFPYDSNQEPFPSLRAGQKVPLKLYKAYLGSNINMAKALILNTPVANGGMGGIQEITVNWKAYGKYFMT